MQKYILKQQFKSFSVSNSEGLHKGYDRFQSLLSKVEIHDVGVSTEDANQKFLRSLPASWSQVSLITRTKLGVDTLSFDDLYNNLRVFESNVKGSTTSSLSTQNVAFFSSESTSSTNEASTAYDVSTSSGHNSQREGSSSYTDELMYSFFANQSNDKTDVLTYHKKLLAEGEKEKEELKAKIEKWQNYFKGLNNLLDSQMSAKDKSGLGYGNKIHKGPIGKLLLSPQQIVIGDPKEITRTKSPNTIVNQTLDDPQKALKNKGIVDSGCSRHMTGNKAFLVDYHDYNGGPVAFRGSKGHITGKGKIRTGKLDFEDVCFVKELQHFNLFSISQMCDKKKKPVRSENQANKTAGPKEANHSAGTQDNIDTCYSEKEAKHAQEYCILPLWSSYTSTIKSSEVKNRGAARASSTNTINIVSTPVSTASPLRVFIAGESSYPDSTIYADQDDSQIPALEDIYDHPSNGSFIMHLMMMRVQWLTLQI
nr:hypothetical protein [Tanacetum cinerariifolium]